MRSKFSGRYFIPYSSEISPYSLTAETVAKESSQSAIEKMDSEIWFPDLQVSDDFELFEEVRYSSTYKTALTLLWMPE